MAVLNEDKERRVIPRWRAFGATLHARELLPLACRRQDPWTLRTLLDTKKQEWLDNKTISFAADLVGTGIALGQEQDVLAAAEFILKNDRDQRPGLQTLARRVLRLDSTTDRSECEEPSEKDAGQVGQEIHKARQKLHNEPRNAFLWTNLARLYATLGQNDQAARAMVMGLELAPTNRFVLRSAARLLVHRDEYRRAHDLLLRSERVKHDPWLVAAEIAVAGAARRSPRLVKVAREMVDDNKFAPLHLSELASALCTLDFEAGRDKDGRKRLGQSLLDPSENAIAQAAWISRRHFGVPAPNVAGAWPPSHEARAWGALPKARWKIAIHESLLWLCDQPFSSRPATLASYIAAMALMDFSKSAEIAQRGLVANPGDFTLINNLAFAKAQLNEISEAKQALARISPTALSAEQQFVWTATSGLIAYREGKSAQGRELYLSVLTRGPTSTDEKRFASAFLWFALEELRIGGAEADRYAREALEKTKTFEAPDVVPLIDRVKTYLRRPGNLRAD